MPRWLSLLAGIGLLVWTGIPSAHAEIAPVELRVMTFNIWVGGELVDFGQVVEAVRAADADIVGLQEAGGNTRRLAEALGWQHVSERMQIISRYPLIDPPGADGHYIFAQVFPGQVVALANMHLPSSDYGPYLAVRDGLALDALLENERVTRLSALQPTLDTAAELVEQGFPVIFTGDFNTPSHLDWTQELAEARSEIPFPVAWPVTLAMETAGFFDTYRAVHPDPVANAGMTWTPGTPAPRLEAGEIVDRIDFVFASAGIEVLNSEIVGERGGQDVAIGLWPYPSDHRAVVATVRFNPAVPPLFTSLDRRVLRVGDPIVVRYAAPNGEETDRIVIVAAGEPADSALMSLPPMEADFYGAVTFGSAMLTPGEYEALLVDGDGRELARNNFWVLAVGAVVELDTDEETYGVGQPITVEWANAPGNRWDWIGIYPAGESDLYNYLGFLYTEAASTGSVIFSDLELPPGTYEARLMRDDWYVQLGAVEFRVE